MWGSRPLADAVTRSTGTLRSPPACSFLMSPATRSTSFLAVLSGARSPPLKILVGGEALADQPRADHRAVALDQAAIGLVGKDDLGDAGDRQRIGEPGQQ